MADRGSVSSWAVNKDGNIAYSFASPSDLSQIYYGQPNAPSKKLTDLNAEVMAGKPIAEVEPLTFTSNDNKYEVEAFLTKPLNWTAGIQASHACRHYRGRPHGQQGPSFNPPQSGIRRPGLGHADGELLRVNWLLRPELADAVMATRTVTKRRT